MKRHVFWAVILVVVLTACVKVEEMKGPAEAKGSENREAPPPPGVHDEALVKLPQPLSVDDAKRVVVEATVFAPWGIGMGGRPMQAQALNVLLGQPEPGPLLEGIYHRSEPPGQLLALCAMKTAYPDRYAALSREILKSNKMVVTYGGCLGDYQPVVEVLNEISSTPICSDIPKSKERILAMCNRAG